MSKYSPHDGEELQKRAETNIRTNKAHIIDVGRIFETPEILRNIIKYGLTTKDVCVLRDVSKTTKQIIDNNVLLDLVLKLRQELCVFNHIKRDLSLRRNSLVIHSRAEKLSSIFTDIKDAFGNGESSCNPSIKDILSAMTTFYFMTHELLEVDESIGKVTEEVANDDVYTFLGLALSLCPTEHIPRLVMYLFNIRSNVRIPFGSRVLDRLGAVAVLLKLAILYASPEHFDAVRHVAFLQTAAVIEACTLSVRSCTCIADFRPTDEQFVIIDAVLRMTNTAPSPPSVGPGPHVINVNSGPGTGKSYTAKLIAAAVRLHPAGPKRILYLVFNKNMEEDAKELLGGLAEVKTISAFALSHVNQHYKRKTIKSDVGLLNAMIKSIYQFKKYDYYGGILVRKALEAFWCTDDERITIEHFPESNRSLEILKKYVRWAQTVSDELMNPMSEDRHLPLVACEHILVRMVRDERIRYTRHDEHDVYIIDECQDINRAVAAILASLHGKLVVQLGDSNQAIYNFKGNMANSVHSFSESKFASLRHLQITQTWRFGTEIANVANIVLRCVKGQSRLVVGCGPTGDVYEPTTLNEALGITNDGCLTVICRSNARVIETALQLLKRGKKVAIINSKSISVFFAPYDRIITELQNPKTAFKHYKPQRGEDELDAEVRARRTFVLTYPGGHLQLKLDLEYIKASLSPHCRYAQVEVAVGTVHQTKGSQYPAVFLHDDFAYNEDLTMDPSEKWAFQQDVKTARYGSTELGTQAHVVEEFNLLFVALTRAQTALFLNRISSVFPFKTKLITDEDLRTVCGPLLLGTRPDLQLK